MRKLLPLLFFLASCATLKPPIPEPRDAVVSPHYQGLDLLGLAKQNIPMIAQTIEPNTMIGLFADSTFGPNALANLEVLLKTGKVNAFRAHILWTNHATPSNANNLILIGARRIAALHSRYPNVACFISPICEYNEKDQKKVEEWANIIEKEAMGCVVVLSPSGIGATIPGMALERHDDKATKAFGKSTDGSSIWDSDSASYVGSGISYTLAWWLRSNLTVSGPYIPPSKRTNPATRDDILQAQDLFRTPDPKPVRGYLPPGCKTTRELTGKELWKTNAEIGPTPDPRANKPLLISRSKNSTLSIVNSKGSIIGCLKYYGTYSPYGPGWVRHYAGSCDGNTALSLKQKAGSEWGYVKDGTTCLLVNLLRRTGNTR